MGGEGRGKSAGLKNEEEEKGGKEGGRGEWEGGKGGREERKEGIRKRGWWKSMNCKYEYF